MPASQPPPSSAIPGKSSSPGPYLAGIIILFLAAVGLFVWKTKQSTPTVTTQSATVMVSAVPLPPPPPLYAPPPPPKLDEEPDAGLDAGKSQASVKGTGGAGGPAAGPCGASCTGASTADLQNKLRGTAQSAQGCYNRALRTSEASGKIIVSVQVSATGSVCSAAITKDEVHSSEINTCILNKFRAAQFPPPSGGCITANIPISFSIKQ